VREPFGCRRSAWFSSRYRGILYSRINQAFAAPVSREWRLSAPGTPIEPLTKRAIAARPADCAPGTPHQRKTDRLQCLDRSRSRKLRDTGGLTLAGRVQVVRAGAIAAWTARPPYLANGPTVEETRTSPRSTRARTVSGAASAVIVSRSPGCAFSCWSRCCFAPPTPAAGRTRQVREQRAHPGSRSREERDASWRRRHATRGRAGPGGGHATPGGRAGALSRGTAAAVTSPVCTAWRGSKASSSQSLPTRARLPGMDSRW
jgi:hypothetical protein